MNRLFFCLKGILTGAVLILIFGSGSFAQAADPLMINQILIDPADSGTIYAAARPQGVLKSTDRGKTWFPARLGLKNTSAFHIAIHPKHSRTLYLGTFGGGIYRSDDAARTWSERNRGLGNTNIHALAFNPGDPENLLVSTSTGEMYETKNGAGTWTAAGGGLPDFKGEIFASILVSPETRGGFYLMQGGIFRKSFGSEKWEAMEHNLGNRIITSSAYDSKGEVLYAGTMKSGIYKTLPGTGLMASKVGEFSPIGKLLGKEFIRWIKMDPSNPSTMYVGVIGKGVYKSFNGGESWSAINKGFSDREIISFAIDPHEPKNLYAGSEGKGIYLSHDGGKSWVRPEAVHTEPTDEIVGGLLKFEPLTPGVNPPGSFSKCNRCHGWTEPGLNQKRTYWRVPPNAREWGPTVRRMSQGAGLAPGEEKEIVEFLNGYAKDRDVGVQ